MRIDPNVLAHIEKFIELAKKYPDAFWKKYGRREDYWYHTGKHRKYVYVRAGMFLFLVDAQAGQVRNGLGRRHVGHGNISELLDAKDWKRGRIQSNRNGVPVNQRVSCEVCGRTAGVRPTVLGRRCRYCRGSDTRHVNIIRRLGGTPTVNGRPLGTYLKDE